MSRNQIKCIVLTCFVLMTVATSFAFNIDRDQFFTGKQGQGDPAWGKLAGVKDIERNQYGFSSQASREQTMFRLGAAAVMLEVQLHAGDTKPALSFAGKIEGLLSSVGDSNAARAALTRLKGSLASGKDVSLSWQEFAAALRNTAHTPDDTTMMSLGAWNASSRILLAGAGADKLDIARSCLQTFSALGLVADQTARLLPTAGVTSINKLVKLAEKKALTARDVVSVRKAVNQLYELLV